MLEYSRSHTNLVNSSQKWRSDIRQYKNIVNSLMPIQNGRHFADDIFNSIFSNENVWTTIEISLKFFPKGLINNIPALVQIMAWRRPGDKPLSEPVVVSLLTHICVTRPQWVNSSCAIFFRGHVNMHLHFMSFFHMDLTQVVQIVPYLRQGPTYSKLSIS